MSSSCLFFFCAHITHCFFRFNINTFHFKVFMRISHKLLSLTPVPGSGSTGSGRENIAEIDLYPLRFRHLKSRSMFASARYLSYPQPHFSRRTEDRPEIPAEGAGSDQEILRVQTISRTVMCRLLHTLYPSTQGRLGDQYKNTI